MQLRKKRRKKDDLSFKQCPQLLYDSEWISILQSTQDLMPLTDMKHDFSFLCKDNQEVAASIKEKKSKLDKLDMTIPFNEEHVFEASYDRVHPQTLAFVKRFDLDLRLFEVRDKGNEESKSDQGKRTYSKAFEPKTVDDQNEIDLGLE